MKNKLSTFISLLLITFSYSSAQAIIKVKPTKHKVIVAKKRKTNSKYILISGHWKLSSKSHQYIWVHEKWIKSKKGQIWMAGHWTKKSDRFLWVKGYWKYV